MFSCCYSITARSVHDNNTLLACCFGIDIVNTRACAANYLEFFTGSNNLCCRLCCGSYDKAVIITDNLFEFIRFEACFYVDLKSTLFKYFFSSC